MGHCLNRRDFSRLAAGLVALPLAARAQGEWPTRPVTVVVPFAPGGAGNGSVRIVGEAIAPRLGQPLVVDNRPGGGGVTGTQMVCASADDHLLLMGSTTMTILPALRRDLNYDVQRDLQPMGMLSSQPLAIVTAVQGPLKSLDQAVQQARTGELSVGNSGVGTLSHLATALMNRRLGLRLLPVPYKGDSVLLPDVVAGTVQLGMVNLPVAMQLIRGGRLRALAITAAHPDPALPEVPLLRTLGSDFVITGWAALFAARKVPPAGVERFSTLLREVLGDAAVREKFAGFGVAPEASTTAQLREFVRRETVRWGEVVRASDIRLE